MEEKQIGLGVFLSVFWECLTWLHDGVNIKALKMKNATTATVTSAIIIVIIATNLKQTLRSADEPLGWLTISKLSVSILISISVSSCPACCFSMMQSGIFESLLVNIAHVFPHTNRESGNPISLTPSCNKKQTERNKGIPLLPHKTGLIITPTCYRCLLSLPELNRFWKTPNFLIIFHGIQIKTCLCF